FSTFSFSRYLTVQFVRFFWKRESNQKAKILRKVDYPLELDVYDFCSDDLRKKLEAPRQILRNEEGKRLGLKVNEKSSVQKENDVKMSDAEGSSNGGGEPSVVPMEEGEKETQMTGIYDLVAVLTHKGRSADSGHYVGWVKQENGKWIEFDDDNPKPKIEDDITRLSGGGDWHMAYIILYKARVVSVLYKDLNRSMVLLNLRPSIYWVHERRLNIKLHFYDEAYSISMNETRVQRLL
ncbi:Ubiquitin carboxyl-terminal hydrolase 6, partial [Mucuna pruriens]